MKAKTEIPVHIDANRDCRGTMAAVFGVKVKKEILARALTRLTRRIWHPFISRSYTLALVVLISGFISTVFAFLVVRRQEHLVAEQWFIGEAVGAVGAVSEGLDQSVQLVRSLDAHFNATDRVTADGFRAFTQPLLSHYPGVQALEWIPLVTNHARSMYEKAAQRDFPGYQISERKEQGIMKRAGSRPEYFPVYFVEPYATNEAAVGFDLASNPSRREALTRARDAGNIVATERIMLVQEKAGQYGFLLFDPVYRKGASLDTPVQKHANLVGFVLGVFRIQDVVETAIHNDTSASAALDLSLYDESAEQGKGVLYRHLAQRPGREEESSSRAGAGLVYTAKLEIAGRTWLLKVTPGPGQQGANMRRAWLVLLGGVTITLILAACAQTIRRHSEALIAANEVLATSEGLRRRAQKIAHLGAWNCNLTENRVTCSEEVCDIFNITPAEGDGTLDALLSRIHPEDRERVLDGISKSAADKASAGINCRILRPDGTVAFIYIQVDAAHERNGDPLNVFGTMQDITESKNTAQVRYLAYYDALTGLPNRALLQDRITQVLAIARRHREKAALLFLDLDRFKTINDSLGHSIGDLVLKEVARQLNSCAREEDTVARLGGDEFVVLMTSLTDIADVAVAANRITEALRVESSVQGHLVRISCSLGISIFPDHGTDSETLLKSADAAMYCAKEAGRDNFQFFTQDMNVQAVERLALESGLRLALEKKELFLVYEPQVDLATGNIIGGEALLRWRHPELCLILPNKFIPIAENSGLIISIGQWVLRTACAQARQWQDEGLLPLPVAVNVSAVQFRQRDFSELVARVLRETGLAPQYLELELTESVLLSNVNATLSVLQELKEMGVKLSIDDFGTGYSSLSYLRQLPVHKLKIDQSFVQNMTVNAPDAAVVAAIISMARSLHLKVIAEGVEREEQMLFLRANNCDEVQGYYFSPPLAAADFAKKVRSTLSLRSDPNNGG
ncbi:MAG: EAL domain-containing protein [Candidatus Korobacteraceae bacterium]